MTIGRAFIVIDLSQVCQLDRDDIFLLLCCLEEAIKCDGNVKLSAVPPEARAALDAHGLNRLFEIFQTTTDAVNSFNRVARFLAPSLSAPAEQFPASITAA